MRLIRCMKKIFILVFLFIINVFCFAKSRYSIFVYEGKVGLLNENLDIVLNPEFDFIELYEDYLLARKLYGSTFVYDYELKVIYEMKSRCDFNALSKDFCVFSTSKNDFILDVNTGKIETTKLLFAPQRLAIKENETKYIAGQWKYYSSDLKTEYFTDKAYWAVYPFNNDRGIVMYDAMAFAIVDSDLNFIRTDISDCAEMYSENLIAIKTADGKSGFADTTGQFVFYCDFYKDESDYAPKAMATLNYYFRDGFVCVQGKSKKWFIFDIEGNSIEIGNGLNMENTLSSEGFFLVSRNNDGKKQFGFINQKGDEIIPCRFDSASNYCNDFARVIINGKKGVIDKNGNLYYSEDLIKGIKKTMAY